MLNTTLRWPFADWNNVVGLFSDRFNVATPCPPGLFKVSVSGLVGSEIERGAAFMVQLKPSFAGSLLRVEKNYGSATALVEGLVK